MILYMHHHANEWHIKYVITEGKATKLTVKDRECVKISESCNRNANRGGITYPGAWRGIFVMNLETGEIIHDAESSKSEAYRHDPWLTDSLLRATKVAEYLKEKELK